MWRLHSIEADGYRCFHGAGPVRLAPLTLLFGRNNAGKSSLLRLLPILARSVDSPRSPFDLSGPAGRDATFLDSLWRGEGSNGRRLTLRLTWMQGDHERTDELGIRYDDHAKRVHVHSLILTYDGDSVWRGQVEPPDLDEWQVDGAPTSIQWSGIAPAEGVTDAELAELRRRLRSLRSVQYLGPVRVPPGQTTQLSGATAHRIRPDGSNAAEILLQDDGLREAVATWFEAEPVTRLLDARTVAADRFRLTLDAEGHSTMGVALADNGDGMGQVIAVLTAAALAQRQRGSLLAVEDPGAHLHDDARHHLADHLARLAADDDPPTMVLETHSRTFLLGVQLAIADPEHPLSAEDVVLYWMSLADDGRAIPEEVTFDAHGAPEQSTLRGTLSTDHELARRLSQLQFGGS